MLVVPSGGQICNQFNGATWWSNLELMQVAPPGHQLVAKFQTLPVAQRTQGIEFITWIIFSTISDLYTFISAAGITQVLDSIVWGWCASGNVFTQKVKSFSFNLPEPYSGTRGADILVHLNFYSAVSDVCRFVDWEVECCQRLYATLWARRVRLGVIKLVFSSLHYKRFDIYWTGTI